jgi:hypothetical protein
MPDRPSDNGFLVSLLTFQFGRRGARLRAQKARFPDEPWRWREDWESGVIPASKEGGPAGAWVLALLFLGVGVGVTFAIWGDLMSGKEPVLWVFTLFPFIGFLLTLRAFVVTARAMKYGRPILRMESTPCVLGGQLQGTIEFRNRRLPASEAAELELQERHVIRRKTTKNRTQSETRVVWSLRLPIALHGGERSVPVSFPIPSNGKEADAVSLGGVSWRIRLRAVTAGPDLAVAFNLPVFAGEGGDSAQTKKAIEAAQAESAIAAGEDALIESLQREGVRLKRHPAGLELRVRPLGIRRAGFAITALVFMAIPAAFWFVALRTNPSVWRWLGFTPLAALGALVGSLTLTKSFRVRAGSKGLRITRQILGFPTAWQVPYESIESIQPNSTMSTSGAEGTVRYYDLDIKWQVRGKSRKVCLGLGITDKALAAALAQALRHAREPKL